jgi:hypothetical protein
MDHHAKSQQICKDSAMAFADPQSITISGSAISLPRISSGANSSIYSSADSLVHQTVSSTYGKRWRRTFRVDHRKVAADPFAAGVNREFSMSTYVVIDVPPVGYTVAEAKAVVDGMLASLSASTGAKITALLGGEN